jgi:hypothetical protein
LSLRDNQIISRQNSACVIVAPRQSLPRRDRQNGHPDCRCFPIQIVALHQASAFGTDVSGQFFASAPKKFTGPIEAMRQPHFHDRANQEAAWQAIVKVSGVDLS